MPAQITMRGQQREDRRTRGDELVPQRLRGRPRIGSARGDREERGNPRLHDRGEVGDTVFGALAVAFYAGMMGGGDVKLAAALALWFSPGSTLRFLVIMSLAGGLLTLVLVVAHRLRGKHKPVYTPHVDTGDYFVVINAEKIVVTGNKLLDKKYHRFTGYIGNLKTENLAQALERHPERVIEIAVKGMLPKNPLGRAMYKKLKVYKGSEHPHAAQQPQVLDI